MEEKHKHVAPSDLGRATTVVGFRHSPKPVGSVFQSRRRDTVYNIIESTEFSRSSLMYARPGRVPGIVKALKISHLRRPRTGRRHVRCGKSPPTPSNTAPRHPSYLAYAPVV